MKLLEVIRRGLSAAKTFLRHRQRLLTGKSTDVGEEMDSLPEPPLDQDIKPARGLPVARYDSRERGAERVRSDSGAFASRAKRAQEDVVRQFGKDPKWVAINDALWSWMERIPEHAITPIEVDAIAEETGRDTEEVLALLSLISRPAAHLLKMEYVGPRGEVPYAEVTRHVRAWWKDKTLSDEDWEEWADQVVVRWSLVDSQESLQ
jgi:hypothetical protein